MPRPFLVARFVCFALLVNLNVLNLVFAAWNANVTRSAGLLVPATTVLLTLSSCSAFFFITLGLAELLVRHANTSHILFECCWSAVLSIFQMGAAISVSVNDPGICGNTFDWDLCASSSLLVPTSWLSSLVASTYFFVLFFTTVAHSRVQADVWHKTVYSVQWFNEPNLPTFSVKRDEHSESVCSRLTDDVESCREPTYDRDRAPWSRLSNIRRGVDTPFKRQGPTSSVRNSTSAAIVSLPIVPHNAQGRATSGSRFIEKFRESQLIFRSENPMPCVNHSMIRQDPFPLKIDNHDLPIPLPRLSEWIRADAVKGISVHTIPQSP